MNPEIDTVLKILEKAGQSSDVSREAVLKFHGNIDDMGNAAQVWANHHGVFTCSKQDMIVAYATAVDLGYRIAMSQKEVKYNMADEFVEWCDWKKQQKENICDYLYCRNKAVWYLPKNHIYFCKCHISFDQMKNDYGEEPKYLEVK
jgi:hypothetical protein